MNLYKTAISALLIAPVIGGISIHMIKNYQNLQKQAEELAAFSEERLAEVEAMLNEGSDMSLAGQNPADEEWLPGSDVTEEVIRFHVRANSDSEEDQALKLEVRDAILQELGAELEQADDKDAAREIMENSLDQIEEIGRKVIQEAGYDYEIHAYLTEEEFPIKDYGDLRFPAGEYEALRVDIGKKNGGNWWCVMYPGLCFVDAAGGVVATEGKEELQQLLTPEEYEEILIRPQENSRVEYRSWIWDTLFGNKE